MSHHFITRFAPSPTGLLHLGHAYAAKVAYDLAVQSEGKMILRIDDIDYTRCRDEFIHSIYADMNWLGIEWYGSIKTQAKHKDPPKQSNRIAAYKTALETLKELGLVYPCYLTRRELNALLSAPHAQQQSPQRIVETDRVLCHAEKEQRRANGRSAAWRLRMDNAIKTALCGKSEHLSWFDHLTGYQQADPSIFGDIVIARADIATSYHLSVVVDDAIDGITLVTRGLDLAPSTHIHRLLQALLKLPVPDYCHHAVIVDKNGERLAKRNAATSLKKLRQRNFSPSKIFTKIPSVPKVYETGKNQKAQNYQN